VSGEKQRIALPKKAEDRGRWEFTAMARRIMDTKGWLVDLDRHMADHIDPRRKAAWGPPTRALNLFRSVVHQLAVLYDDDPIVRNDELTDDAEQWLTDQNLFAQHQLLNREVVGLRDAAIRIRWRAADHTVDSGITIRRVCTETLVVTANANALNVPVRIEEAVKRTNSKGQTNAYWDVWSIEDEGAPFFRIETAAWTTRSASTWTTRTAKARGVPKPSHVRPTDFGRIIIIRRGNAYRFDKIILIQLKLEVRDKCEIRPIFAVNGVVVVCLHADAR